MAIRLTELRRLFAKVDQAGDARAFYDRFPRNTFWGSENNRCSTQILREAPSLQDMVRRMQATDLFSVNADSEARELAVEWLVDRYRSCGIEVDEMPPEIQESAVSDPAICGRHGDRSLSVDFLRTLSVACDIRRCIQRGGKPLRVLELGAGLGHLARTLRITGVSRSHLILDLPESLVFSCAFLTANFPEASYVFVSDADEARSVKPDAYDFVFVPSCYAEQIDVSGSELFVNTASLGEMRNETIRYWMDFIQRRTAVKHLFTQNRFLNTIDPFQHAWRWEENEASVHYDASWAVLKWDLEPPWFRCPYVAPIAARHLEIAATRVPPADPAEVQCRTDEYLRQIKLQDWYRCGDRPAFMSMGQNAFHTDVTMTGTLFKLWECVRLQPSADTVSMLLRYTASLIHGNSVVFEEARYYESLLVQLVEREDNESLRPYAAAIRERLVSSVPQSPASVALVAETREYNIVAVEVIEGSRRVKRFIALLKSLGPTNLLQERLGEKELAPVLLMAHSVEEAIQRARSLESPEAELAGTEGEYNIVKGSTSYLAVAQRLGQVHCFVERIGERDLPPIVFRAETIEELREKVRGGGQPSP